MLYVWRLVDWTSRFLISRLRLTVFCLLVLCVLSPRGTSAQTSLQIPERLTTACDLDRVPLDVEIVAQNPEVYPQLVERVPGGWLVFDRYSRRVLELDDNLVEVGRWGRLGDGPGEYRKPIGFGRSVSGEVVIVDASPPSVIVYGERPSEYSLGTGPTLTHATVEGGQIRFSTTEGSIISAHLNDPQVTSVFRSGAELGITRNLTGAVPEMLLRTNPEGESYVGFQGPSTIFALDGANPRRMVQRCVPEELRTIHDVAPTIEVPGFGMTTYTIKTLQDFLVLRSGDILAFGALKVRNGDESARSIELYDSQGDLVHAWSLNGSAFGMFDEFNSRRILIWDREDIDGIQLIEVKAEGYPF